MNYRDNNQCDLNAIQFERNYSPDRRALCSCKLFWYFLGKRFLVLEVSLVLVTVREIWFKKTRETLTPYLNSLSFSLTMLE